MTRRTLALIVFWTCIVVAPFASIALKTRGVRFPWYYLAGFAIIIAATIAARLLMRPLRV